MWNRKLIISKHVKERFEQRNIKFSKKNISIESQIRYDLKPLNIRTQKKLNDTDYKVTTRQGKVYIITLLDDKRALIKTVYKIDIRKELFQCTA
ncbi:MAG TPA: hypothetical protein DCW90_06505 [Lachnospiraceae bacterium]|nr:hypothetical protein [uncultured Lachnoclostridium sp.]HAU85150.1 hypothetical protein [Lachnospiraceae bacterium]